MNPDQHYEEAERLLQRSDQLTKDWVEIARDSEGKTVAAVSAKLLNLEILARMLTGRAHAHATLATAVYVSKPHPVSVPRPQNLNGGMPRLDVMEDGPPF